MKHKLIFKPDSTFEEAIRLLDLNGNGFLPIVDNKDHLIGILTDGDIRRAILNKKEELKDIINNNPNTVSSDTPYKQAIHILRSIHRRHLPVIDKDNKLVKVITLDDLDYNLKNNKVVIMAGGLGTRLGKITENIPKPMLQLGGKPLLEQLINSFVDHGFSDFLISVNYKANVIKDYFNDGNKHGVSISYIEEKKRLGTAGALSLIKEDLTEPFFVINGDILTSMNFKNMMEFHNEKNAFGTMCVKEHEYQVPYATVKTDASKLIEISEKPTMKYLVNSGIYILAPEALKDIPEDTFYDMPELFEEAAKDNKIVETYKINDFWLDIGQIKDYEIASEHFKKFY
jgi:dTDP-glucose pyrophosphorylase